MTDIPGSPGSIVVVGSINADLTTTVHRHPHPGETLLGGGGEISAGGKGANQAVAAAQLGAEVHMVGAVGSDTMADSALVHMRASGADMSAVHTVDGPTAIPTPTVEAVDTTGSGDAFAGALVAKLADGHSLVEAARFAARVGAFAATRRGAQASYPTLVDDLPTVTA